MHRESDAALSLSAGRIRPRHLLHAIVCLASVVAGAALVATATPRTTLTAGPSPSNSPGDTVLLDFTATWCGPCQQMSPIIDRLAQQGYPVRKVDVDRQRDIAERFQITSMPTFVLLVNGREIMRQSGATSEAQLRRMLQQIPALQQEIAANESRNNPVRALPTTAGTESNEEFGPSPFQIDLGAPQAAESVAQIPPPKRGFALPFFQKERGSAPSSSRATTSNPIVRAQSVDGDTTAATAITNDPLLASTRLQVKDSAGINFGSGTIIESRVGRTLILTCGHIFRNLEESGVVEVNVFLPGRTPVTYIGKVVKFDLEADIGLVAIPTSERIPMCSLATLDKPLQVGDSLVSIGCAGGESPTRESAELTSLNRYAGPDNIECTGLPAKGRSGGGLFRGNELVGVCFAADSKDQRGVYTGLTPVYQLLEQAGYAHLVPGARTSEPPVVAEVRAASPTSVPDAGEVQLAGALPGEVDLGTVFVDTGATTPAVQDASAGELRNVLGQAPDSEVICIVRPKNPQVPSRVVIIHEASPKLIGYLLDSVDDFPAAPASELLTRSESLIPTSATELTTPSPFGPIETLPVRLPAQLPKPARPSSPR